MTKPTLLIDGDHALYVATTSVEREVWGWNDDPDAHVLYSDFDEARQAFSDKINYFKHELSAGDVYLAFTGHDNFRYDIYPEYKGARKSRKPLCYYRLLNHLFTDKAYKSRRYACLEADDLMGIWSTSGNVRDPVIVSEDKDLKTIPGHLYNRHGLHHITELEADYNWHLQTLSGDPVDGFPGLPGCGPVTAAKLLSTGQAKKSPWDTVVEAYLKKGLTEADALVQARLARILRATDWNSSKQEVILWTPKVG